jgi:hypothetical protein
MSVRAKSRTVYFDYAQYDSLNEKIKKYKIVNYKYKV